MTHVVRNIEATPEDSIAKLAKLKHPRIMQLDSLVNTTASTLEHYNDGLISVWELVEHLSNIAHHARHEVHEIEKIAKGILWKRLTALDYDAIMEEAATALEEHREGLIEAARVARGEPCK